MKKAFLVKTIARLVASTLVVGTIVVSAAHAASVYKISKNNDVVYIGGTIHILTEADFPLAAPYEEAYSKADELIFETDIAALKDPAVVQAKMLPIMMQPPGQKLSQQLDNETGKAFTQFLIDRNLPIVQFDALSATGAMLTLTVMEYQAKGFVSEGVDAFYHNKGTEDGKSIAWLESVDTQFALLDSFDNGDPNALIAYTMEEISQTSEIIDALYTAWKTGDLEGLEAAGITQLKSDFPELYKKMMVDRNNAWMPQIEAMFGDDNTEYVLVGAAHLAGDDGLLHLLEEKGYKVEKL
uniref:TraB/GumN family protein n=1 Tax=Ningiella ruwaisensis TaxID=2364274 RepID=UPI0010A0919E|nr:TraB/GumN family protein [Ningiella ruwaisensis]